MKDQSGWVAWLKAARTAYLVTTTSLPADLTWAEVLNQIQSAHIDATAPAATVGSQRAGNDEGGGDRARAWRTVLARHGLVISDTVPVIAPDGTFLPGQAGGESEPSSAVRAVLKQLARKDGTARGPRHAWLRVLAAHAWGWIAPLDWLDLDAVTALAALDKEWDAFIARSLSMATVDGSSTPAQDVPTGSTNGVVFDELLLSAYQEWRAYFAGGLGGALTEPDAGLLENLRAYAAELICAEPNADTAELSRRIAADYHMIQGGGEPAWWHTQELPATLRDRMRSLLGTPGFPAVLSMPDFANLIAQVRERTVIEYGGPETWGAESLDAWRTYVTELIRHRSDNQVNRYRRQMHQDRLAALAGHDPYWWDARSISDTERPRLRSLLNDSRFIVVPMLTIGEMADQLWAAVGRPSSWDDQLASTWATYLTELLIIKPDANRDDLASQIVVDYWTVQSGEEPDWWNEELIPDDLRVRLRASLQNPLFVTVGWMPVDELGAEIDQVRRRASSLPNWPEPLWETLESYLTELYLRFAETPSGYWPAQATIDRRAARSGRSPDWWIQQALSDTMRHQLHLLLTSSEFATILLSTEQYIRDTVVEASGRFMRDWDEQSRLAFEGYLAETGRDQPGATSTEWLIQARRDRETALAGGDPDWWNNRALPEVLRQSLRPLLRSRQFASSLVRTVHWINTPSTEVGGPQRSAADDPATWAPEEQEIWEIYATELYVRLHNFDGDVPENTIEEDRRSLLANADPTWWNTAEFADDIRQRLRRFLRSARADSVALLPSVQVDDLIGQVGQQVMERMSAQTTWWTTWHRLHFDYLTEMIRRFPLATARELRALAAADRQNVWSGQSPDWWAEVAMAAEVQDQMRTMIGLPDFVPILWLADDEIDQQVAEIRGSTDGHAIADPQLRSSLDLYFAVIRDRVPDVTPSQLRDRAGMDWLLIHGGLLPKWWAELDLSQQLLIRLAGLATSEYFRSVPLWTDQVIRDSLERARARLRRQGLSAWLRQDQSLLIDYLTRIVRQEPDNTDGQWWNQAEQDQLAVQAGREPAWWSESGMLSTIRGQLRELLADAGSLSEFTDIERDGVLRQARSRCEPLVRLGTLMRASGHPPEFQATAISYVRAMMDTFWSERREIARVGRLRAEYTLISSGRPAPEWWAPAAYRTAARGIDTAPVSSPTGDAEANSAAATTAAQAAEQATQTAAATQGQWREVIIDSRWRALLADLEQQADQSDPIVEQADQEQRSVESAEVPVSAFPSRHEQILADGASLAAPAEKITQVAVHQAGRFGGATSLTPPQPPPDCVVCFDGVTQTAGPALAVTMPCGHVGHLECLEPWWDLGNLSCPLCRLPAQLTSVRVGWPVGSAESLLVSTIVDEHGALLLVRPDLTVVELSADAVLTLPRSRSRSLPQPSPADSTQAGPAQADNDLPLVLEVTWTGLDQFEQLVRLARAIHGRIGRPVHLVRAYTFVPLNDVPPRDRQIAPQGQDGVVTFSEVAQALAAQALAARASRPGASVVIDARRFGWSLTDSVLDPESQTLRPLRHPNEQLADVQEAAKHVARALAESIMLWIIPPPALLAGQPPGIAFIPVTPNSDENEEAGGALADAQVGDYRRFESWRPPGAQEGGPRTLRAVLAENGIPVRLDDNGQPVVVGIIRLIVRHWTMAMYYAINPATNIPFTEVEIAAASGSLIRVRDVRQLWISQGYDIRPLRDDATLEMLADALVSQNTPGGRRRPERSPHQAGSSDHVDLDRILERSVPGETQRQLTDLLVELRAGRIAPIPARGRDSNNPESTDGTNLDTAANADIDSSLYLDEQALARLLELMTSRLMAADSSDETSTPTATGAGGQELPNMPLVPDRPVVDPSGSQVLLSEYQWQRLDGFRLIPVNVRGRGGNCLFEAVVEANLRLVAAVVRQQAPHATDQWGSAEHVTRALRVAMLEHFDANLRVFRPYMTSDDQVERIRRALRNSESRSEEFDFAPAVLGNMFAQRGVNLRILDMTAPPQEFGSEDYSPITVVRVRPTRAQPAVPEHYLSTRPPTVQSVRDGRSLTTSRSQGTQLPSDGSPTPAGGAANAIPQVHPSVTMSSSVTPGGQSDSTAATPAATSSAEAGREDSQSLSSPAANTSNTQEEQGHARGGDGQSRQRTEPVDVPSAEFDALLVQAGYLPTAVAAYLAGWLRSFDRRLPVETIAQLIADRLRVVAPDMMLPGPLRPDHTLLDRLRNDEGSALTRDNLANWLSSAAGVTADDVWAAAALAAREAQAVLEEQDPDRHDDQGIIGNQVVRLLVERFPTVTFPDSTYVDHEQVADWLNSYPAGRLDLTSGAFTALVQSSQRGIREVRAYIVGAIREIGFANPQTPSDEIVDQLYERLTREFPDLRLPEQVHLPAEVVAEYLDPPTLVPPVWSVLTAEYLADWIPGGAEVTVEAVLEEAEDLTRQRWAETAADLASVAVDVAEALRAGFPEVRFPDVVVIDADVIRSWLAGPGPADTTRPAPAAPMVPAPIVSSAPTPTLRTQARQARHSVQERQKRAKRANRQLEAAELRRDNIRRLVDRISTDLRSVDHQSAQSRPQSPGAIAVADRRRGQLQSQLASAKADLAVAERVVKSAGKRFRVAQQAAVQARREVEDLESQLVVANQQTSQQQSAQVAPRGATPQTEWQPASTGPVVAVQEPGAPDPGQPPRPLPVVRTDAQSPTRSSKGVASHAEFEQSSIVNRTVFLPLAVLTGTTAAQAVATWLAGGATRGRVTATPPVLAPDEVLVILGGTLGGDGSASPGELPTAPSAAGSAEPIADPAYHALIVDVAEPSMDRPNVDQSVAEQSEPTVGDRAIPLRVAVVPLPASEELNEQAAQRFVVDYVTTTLDAGSPVGSAGGEIDRNAQLEAWTLLHRHPQISLRLNQAAAGLVNGSLAELGAPGLAAGRLQNLMDAHLFTGAATTSVADEDHNVTDTSATTSGPAITALTPTTTPPPPVTASTSSTAGLVLPSSFSIANEGVHGSTVVDDLLNDLGDDADLWTEVLLADKRLGVATPLPHATTELEPGGLRSRSMVGAAAWNRYQIALMEYNDALLASTEANQDSAVSTQDRDALRSWVDTAFHELNAATQDIRDHGHDETRLREAYNRIVELIAGDQLRAWSGTGRALAPMPDVTTWMDTVVAAVSRGSAGVSWPEVWDGLLSAYAQDEVAPARSELLNALQMAWPGMEAALAALVADGNAAPPIWRGGGPTLLSRGMRYVRLARIRRF